MIDLHHKFMGLALEEALKAKKKNEVPVGGVLIDKNYNIIATNHNRTIIDCDPTSHAEIKILRSAATKLQNYRLLDTILYVTIEPCIMCMGAIIHARISTVVFGTYDKNWGAAGSIYDFTRNSNLNHKVKIIKGIYANKCGSLIRNFFQDKRKQV